jgi:hypothetical protein
MTDTVPLLPIRERIKDLNTKAYYLLVALSFVYRTDSGSRLLKSAFTLTAITAVLPVQDYIESVPWLERFRALKVIFLGVALLLTVFWIWEVDSPLDQYQILQSMGRILCSLEDGGRRTMVRRPNS